MLQELAFTGQWRHYQKRVLDKSEAFMADGHLHFSSSSWIRKTTWNQIYQTLWSTNLILAPGLFVNNGWTGLSKHS